MTTDFYVETIIMTRRAYRDKALRAEMKAKYPDAKIIVSRATPETVCTKCHDEPRRKGQRWGRKCFAAYQRQWSKDNTKLRRGIRALTQKHVRKTVL